LHEYDEFALKFSSMLTTYYKYHTKKCQISKRHERYYGQDLPIISRKMFVKL